MRRLNKLLSIIWITVFVFLIIKLIFSNLESNKRYADNTVATKAWFYMCKNLINSDSTKVLTLKDSKIIDSVKYDYLKFVANTNMVSDNLWIEDSLRNIKIFVCSDSIKLMSDETIKAFYTNIDYIDEKDRKTLPKNFIIVKESDLTDGETLVHELSHYLDNLLGGNKNNTYWSNTYIRKYMDDYLLNYEYDEQYAFEKLNYIGVNADYCFDYVESYKKDGDYYTDPTEFFARTMVLVKKYQYCPDKELLNTLSSNINEETDIIDLLFWCDLDKLTELRNLLSK